MTKSDSSNSPAQQERVNAVLAEYLQSAEKGEEVAPDELYRRYPEFAEELKTFLSAERDLVNVASPLQSALPPDVQAGVVRYFGDYILENELGRGGMGIVYRALQKSLQRRVALKMIRAGRLADDRDKRRFQQEAEAVAQLDHPHIATVYEVGEHQGQQFFTMRLVEGNSLLRADRALRQDLRAVAKLMMKVARAVQFAHGRGVLHRDLKPSNILVDAEGEPCVVDFGLAARIDDDGAVQPTDGIVGTAPYMAPEQFFAHTTDVTTVTDVYGLGTVLYYLLTGRPSFDGQDFAELRHRICRDVVVSPRKTNPGVDENLAAVCIKCLEKDACDRYSSAEALAADLERWGARQPVEARPLPRAERFKLWVARNPVVSSLSGLALLLVVVAVAAISTGYVEATRARDAESRQRRIAERALAAAEQARDNEAKQRELAVKNFGQYRGAVDEFVPLLLERDTSPATVLSRLEKTRDMLTTVVEANPEVREFRRYLGFAHFKIGHLQTLLGDGAEALEAYRQSISIFEALATKQPDDFNAREDLATTLLNTATVFALMKRSDDAFAALDKSATHFRAILDNAERLASADPSSKYANPKEIDLIKSHLAQVHYNRARHHHELGDLPKAVAGYRSAVALQEALLAARPDSLRFQDALAGTLTNLCLAYRKLEQLDAGLEAAQRSVALYEKVIDVEEPKPQHIKDACGGYFNLALILRDLRCPADAAQASLSRKKLCGQNPRDLYTVAIDMAQCIPLTDVQAEKDEYAAESLAALRDAIAHGFKNPDTLLRTAYLKPLHAYPEFFELIRNETDDN